MEEEKTIVTSPLPELPVRSSRGDRITAVIVIRGRTIMGARDLVLCHDGLVSYKKCRTCKFFLKRVYCLVYCTS